MQRISFIGSGNVATHLAMSLKKAGCQIVDICSHTFSNAENLAGRVGAKAIHSYEELDQNIDLCIISVPDHAIVTLVNELKHKKFFVVHTSGSIPMDIFDGKFVDYGVFYPLQTFSKEKPVDFERIPVCIESNNKNKEKGLLELASRLSQMVYQLNSEQRKEIHIAAVFACNFTNHLYGIAQKLLESKQVPFEIIKPLIQETAEKVKDLNPIDAQTGPAVRNDAATMSNHMEILRNENDEYAEIYKLMSESILKNKKGK